MRSNLQIMPWHGDAVADMIAGIMAERVEVDNCVQHHKGLMFARIKRVQDRLLEIERLAGLCEQEQKGSRRVIAGPKNLPPGCLEETPRRTKHSMRLVTRTQYHCTKCKARVFKGALNNWLKAVPACRGMAIRTSTGRLQAKGAGGQDRPPHPCCQLVSRTPVLAMHQLW